MAHKLDKAEFEARKQARDDLKEPPGNINSVPALRDRVYKIEQAMGLTVPTIENIVIK